MSAVDISIIIPVFNVEAYIAECLNSVIAQTSKCNLECLIIDDRGMDNSIEIARQVISKYDGPIEFKVVTREQNGGLSAARNTGIRQAQGHYVYFLDSDDTISSDCISSLSKRAFEYPSAQIITGDFQTFPQRDVYKQLSLQGKNFPNFSDDIRWIRSIFLSKFPVISCNKLIKRDFIIQHNLFFKERIIHEDNHWQAQTYHIITSVAFVDKVTYLYRMREGSITKRPNSNARRLENLGIIYHEMCSKNVEWDKYWADWICNSLAGLKYSPRYSEISKEARNIFSSLTKVIFNNKKVPLKMRILFRYWGLRNHFGQDRFFYFLFHQLNH